MASNTETIVSQLRHDFEALVDYVSGPESSNHDVYTVELHLFRRLLALGAVLLKLFFRTRAATRPPTPTTPEGHLMRYHGCRSLRYISIFGELSLKRHYFTAAGLPGLAPLDAELSLPQSAYSDLLREWGAYGASAQAYRENQALLQRLLGLNVPLASLQQQARRSAQDVDAFYAQPKARQAPLHTGSILVAQADGKGVPMILPVVQEPARLETNQRRGTKKEAVVTCLYSISPYVRSAEEVAAALLHEGKPSQQHRRPIPVGKEQHATLAGKALACADLAQRAAQREGAQIQHRVALTDGAEALQAQMQRHCPGHSLILDIMHANEYLWDAATALVGEAEAKRRRWLRPKLVQLLEGKSAEVIRELEEAAAAPRRTRSQRKILERTIGYYRRNQAYMRYDHYLAQGWPIGTGVVEGACGHLVKDRMEQAGMRWTPEGAQAILELRAVRLNDDWEAYWRFHRQQQHQRLYGAATAALPEEMLLRQAA
jgi:hypothetical protein